MMQSALIIGGDSTIGAALAKRLTMDGVKFSVTSRKSGPITLDLAASPENWPALPQADVAYLCAAVTGLETCENDPESTRRINVTHMQALAERLLAQGSYVVFLSSNQVFDGEVAFRKADEAPCPINEYGRQKAEFEKLLMQQRQPAAVLRLTKVIAGRMPILNKWETTLKEGKNIEAFGDLVFAPLPLGNVVEALVLLGNYPLLDPPPKDGGDCKDSAFPLSLKGEGASQRLRGIFQLSGSRDVSYYEIAAAFAGDASRVVRTNAQDSGIRPQFLPKHGTLEQSSLFSTLPVADPLSLLL